MVAYTGASYGTENYIDDVLPEAHG